MSRLPAIDRVPTTLERLLDLLRTIRIDPARLETGIHQHIAAWLNQACIPFEHERPIAPRCRVDFLADGIVIEVKKGKPNSTRVIEQLERYCSVPLVRAVIMVVERNIFRLPTMLNGKPVECISLSANWGLAL